MRFKQRIQEIFSLKINFSLALKIIWPSNDEYLLLGRERVGNWWIYGRKPENVNSISFYFNPPFL